MSTFGGRSSCFAMSVLHGTWFPGGAVPLVVSSRAGSVTGNIKDAFPRGTGLDFDTLIYVLPVCRAPVLRCKIFCDSPEWLRSSTHLALPRSWRACARGAPQVAALCVLQATRSARRCARRRIGVRGIVLTTARNFRQSSGYWDGLQFEAALRICVRRVRPLSDSIRIYASPKVQRSKRTSTLKALLPAGCVPPCRPPRRSVFGGAVYVAAMRWSVPTRQCTRGIMVGAMAWPLCAVPPLPLGACPCPVVLAHARQDLTPASGA